MPSVGSHAPAVPVHWQRETGRREPERNAEPTLIEVRPGPVGVAILVLRGLSDSAALERAAQALRFLALPDRIVADLSEVTLVDPAIMEVLASSLLAGPGQDRRLCLVCSRLSGRRLLRTWSNNGVAVFRTIADALRTMSPYRDGPGDLWPPAPASVLERGARPATGPYRSATTIVDT